MIAENFGICIGIFFWTFVVSKCLSLALGGGTSLVVKKLTIRRRDHEVNANAVEMSGRREGIIAFLLTLAGLSPTTSLYVNERESVCETSGLLGVGHRSIPVDRIAQVTSGSKVAFEYVVGAIATALIGGLMAIASLARLDLIDGVAIAVVTTVFVALCVAMYHINKRFYVGVFGQGGWPMMLAFKPNVIEGVQLNLERAMEIAAVIRELVVDARRDPSRPIASPLAVAAPPAAASTPASVVHADGVFADTAPSPRSLMFDAQALIRSGRREDAIAVLRLIVHRFPDSPEATQSRRSLERAGIDA